MSGGRWKKRAGDLGRTRQPKADCKSIIETKGGEQIYYEDTYEEQVNEEEGSPKVFVFDSFLTKIGCLAAVIIVIILIGSMFAVALRFIGLHHYDPPYLSDQKCFRKRGQKMNIIQEVNQAREQIVKYRQDLHRCPETAFEEYETTAYIKRQLDAMGISYKPLYPTGIVAEIGKGREAGALRADIDALKVEEETGCSFGSEHQDICMPADMTGMQPFFWAQPVF